MRRVARVGVALVGLCVALAFTVGCSNSSNRTAVRYVTVHIGDPPLDGLLTLPAGDAPAPVVLMLSGSGPVDKDEAIGPNKPFRDIADGLADLGIGTLRYDKRTLRYAGSVHKETYTPTAEYVPDALAALNLLRARNDVDHKRVFVLGHSLGGTMAPKIAAADKSLAGVILMAAPAEPLAAALLRQVTYLATLPDPIGAKARGQLPRVTELERQIDSPTFSKDAVLHSELLGGTGPAYFLDLRDYDQLAVAASLSMPILLLQGDRDYQVTVADNFDKWVAALAAKSNVTSHRYPLANHLLIDGSGPPSPADYYGRHHVNKQVIADIADWVKQTR